MIKNGFKNYSAALAFTAIGALSGYAFAQQGGPVVPVTVENFIRAETDLYFSAVALKEGGFGKFEHHREVSDVDSQTIIRMNRERCIPQSLSIWMPVRRPSHSQMRGSGSCRCR